MSQVIRRTIVISVITLLFAVNAGHVLAQDSNAPYNADLGGVQLVFNTPEGFFNPKSEFPELWKNQLRFTPPNNELIAYFISKDDYKAAKEGGYIEQFLVVQVVKQLKGRKADKKILVDVLDTLKKQQDQIMSQLPQKVDKLLDSASKSLSKEIGSDMKIELVSSTPLGIYHTEDDTFSFGLLLKYTASDGSATENFAVVGGATFVLVKDRLVFLYTYHIYESKQDFEWVKSFSQSWARKVINDNQ